MRAVRRARLLAAAALTVGLALAAPVAAGAEVPVTGPALRPADPVPGPILNVSQPCTGSNAEVWQAADPVTGNIYEVWMGCGAGIGFDRSTNGGKTFSAARELPQSGGALDPAIAVGPDGSVYASFMKSTSQGSFPVLEISSSKGASFPVVSKLIPAKPHNWGDRDFIAIGPRNQIYVTWDYGPKNNLKYICTPGGSCSFTAGDVNVVLQKSTNGGSTWSAIIPISPGYPNSGGDLAPIVVEHNGRLDVLYQGYQVLNTKTDTLGPAHAYFTSSTDRGAHWTAPVMVGPANLTMSQAEWWIDSSIGVDSAGNLYAAWDSQSGGTDVPWLAYSTNHGATWSNLIQVSDDADPAMHLVQVVGGAAGIAYVGWLTNAAPGGYAQYLRPFSITQGWLTGSPLLVSRTQYGASNVWPGDTFGLSVLPGGSAGGRRVSVSWGSALSSKSSSVIWQSNVTGLP